MKILIPTAKELNLTASSATPNPLSAQTQAVLDELATMSVTDLASFYKISSERAEVEWQALQALREGTAQDAPALYLFDGLMYRHIKRQDYTKEESHHSAPSLGLYDATQVRWEESQGILERSL